MKLIIQIPCFNEEKTLPQVVRDLPQAIPGIDVIEILVVDDGSSDQTVAVARSLGVQHVLQLGRNCGLARAFSLGIQQAVKLGADIIVNTDGDNQYCGADIARLVQPILKDQADMVVGCRPIDAHPEFSWLKKLLQKLGSATLRSLSQTTVRDAASGFRAITRSTAQRLFVHSQFSYCMETLIQAGNLRLHVASVDVRVNLQTRPSRLFRTTPEYVWKSGVTIMAMFVHYRPSRFFGTLASICFGLVLILGLRFLWLVYLFPPAEPHRTYIPSLIFMAILTVVGTGMVSLAVIAELIRSQSRLMEEVMYQLRIKED